MTENPSTMVVIYDGNCRFCQAQVTRLAQWDKRGRLAFISLHDPDVARRFPDLTHDQLMRQMYVIDTDGHHHSGAAAVRRVARCVPRLWPIVPLLHIPFSLPCWQWIYRQVALRRYLIAGKIDCEDGACDVHFK